MENAETLIIKYWPQVTAALVGVWYVSSHLGNLKNSIDRLGERLNSAEEKIVSLFELHNQEVARKLSKLKGKDDD